MLGGIVVAIVRWLSADVGTRCVVALAGRHRLPMLVAFPLGILASGPIVVPAIFLVYELFGAVGLGTSGLEGLADYSPARAARALVASSAYANLLEALKPAVRGEITALHAEQHYVRVYTIRGQDLIHFRFSDAVAVVAHLRGAQVHRSWWVARRAVKDSDGRTLVTVDGFEVPIGRTYARDARRAGLSD